MPTKAAKYQPTCSPARTVSTTPPRLSSSARGYGRAWRALRLSHLADNPLCVTCEGHGTLTTATDVDHVIPHKGDHTLFWDADNLASLCHSCHSRKTATQDGGLGNPTIPH